MCDNPMPKSTISPQKGTMNFASGGTAVAGFDAC